MIVRVLCVFAISVLAAGAIVWRADVESVETEAKGEMKQAGKLFYLPLKVFGGSCVAIGGEWVLTSRHGTAKWSAESLAVNFSALGGGTYQVKEVILPEKGDLALLRVEKVVKGAEELAVYDGDEEVGKRVWIGGFGLAGPTGKTGGVGKFHAGHNRIDKIRSGKLSLTLSKPDDPKVEKDEATVAIFDSGSPLFIETKDGWQLAGIASTASNGAKPGYGERGNYARVAEAREWIDEVTGR